MGNLSELQKGLQLLSGSDHLLKLLFEAVRATEKVALSLQKQQLSEGYDNKNRLIGTYTKTTEKLAEGTNPRQPKIAGEPYNFQDTGGLFDDMLLIFEGDNVIFYSEDPKTELLVDKYQNLFGLDDYNLNNYLQNSILPILIEKIKTTLKLA